MKFKKFIIPIVFVLLFLFCTISFALGPDFWNNAMDRGNWSQKKKLFNPIDISKVTFNPGNNTAEIQLANGEKDRFINYLVDSKFYRSNWQGMTGTGMAIIIEYRNGTHDSFEYCGSNVFQLEYKGRIFSIKNTELKQILQKYNVRLD